MILQVQPSSLQFKWLMLPSEWVLAPEAAPLSRWRTRRGGRDLPTPATMSCRLTDWWIYPQPAHTITLNELTKANRCSKSRVLVINSMNNQVVFLLNLRLNYLWKIEGNCRNVTNVTAIHGSDDITVAQDLRDSGVSSLPSDSSDQERRHVIYESCRSKPFKTHQLRLINTGAPNPCQHQLLWLWYATIQGC